ncbi:MAG: SDR family NAD(P)-dependent oxidoreductase [Bacteroidota bacterium]
MSKRVIVTGGTGNLGRPVVDKLLEQGYEVLCTRRPDDQVTIDGLEMNQVDLTSERDVESLVQVWKRKFDRIDGLVCLAGGFAMTDIATTKENDLMHMYRLNFLTTFFMASALYPWMKERGGGTMVFTGAKAPLEGGGAGMMPYVLSKSSVMELARLINETGFTDDIQAAVIAPSIIDTPINRQYMPDADFEQWVKPEVIAEHIAFLLSDASNVLSNPVLKLYHKS